MLGTCDGLQLKLNSKKTKCLISDSTRRRVRCFPILLFHLATAFKCFLDFEGRTRPFQDVTRDIILRQAIQFLFSQISDNKQHQRHQVAHDLSPTGCLWDLVVAHGIKFHSHRSLLIADDMAPRLARPQTTSRHIAADIRLRTVSRRTRHEAHPLESHTTFPFRSSPASSCQT